jgi:hypothetical protein
MKHRTYAHHAHPKGVMDTVMEQWPVLFKFCATMDDIKHTNHAVPLRVFHDKKLVNVNDIMDILMGALIEMLFEVHHYAIKGSNPPLIHSMQAYNKSWSYNQVRLGPPPPINKAQKMMAPFE